MNRGLLVIFVVSCLFAQMVLSYNAYRGNGDEYAKSLLRALMEDESAEDFAEFDGRGSSGC
ncbi:unnamed protein product, partial [Didymodactylos carnosus]